MNWLNQFHLNYHLKLLKFQKNLSPPKKKDLAKSSEEEKISKKKSSKSLSKSAPEKKRRRDRPRKGEKTSDFDSELGKY